MASKHETRARHAGATQMQTPKEIFRRNMAVAALVGVTTAAAFGAFAGTYYIDNGDITVDGDQVTYFEDDRTTQNTATDTDVTITQHDSETPTNNTITIIADEDETVEVTIEDINIDATEKIDPEGGDTSENHEAAITIEGDGDIVLELDGKNEVAGGMYHAGVEKNDSDGTGTLTIQDDDNNGILTSTSGLYSAGIGGASGEDSSGLVIAGGTINAISNIRLDTGGAGIGGGNSGDGTVKITGGTVNISNNGNGAGIGGGIDGDGTVKITGGTVNVPNNGRGAEIGGGNCGDGTVEITGGTVTVGNEENRFNASGGYGAGIGGGYSGNGDVTIRGGTVDVTVDPKHDAAGIGDGGYTFVGESKVLITGGKVSVDKKDTLRGAGIGGGGLSGRDNITVTITGGMVNSTGGNDSAGIGAGAGEGATVSISGGTVTAQAGSIVNADLPADNIGKGGCSEDYTEEDDGYNLGTVSWTGGAIIENSDTISENHTHSWGASHEITTPTCTKPGKLHFACACGSEKKEFVYAEHNWGAGVVTKEPTTMAEGERLYTCTACGFEKTEAIPRLAPAPEETSPLFLPLTVTTLTGVEQPYEKTVDAARVLFATPAENAVLTGSLSALAELRAQDVETLVFRTPLCETSVSVSRLLAAGGADDVFQLTHRGVQAALTVAGRSVSI